MAGNFNVSGVVKLVDDFSAKARSIASATDQMSNRMSAFQSRAAGMRSTIVGLGAALAGYLSFNQAKHSLAEAAGEEVAVYKFQHMFSKIKDVIGIGKEELTKELEDLGKRGRIDPDLLMGETSQQLLLGGKVVGKNLLRSIQVATNMAALEGSTETAVQGAFQKIGAMMRNPSRAAMFGKRMGLFSVEEAEQIQKLAKSSKNTVGIQDIILKKLEAQFKDAMSSTAETASATMALASLAPKELYSGIGRVLNQLAGGSIRRVAREVIEFGDSLVAISDKLKEVTDFDSKVRVLWYAFKEAPPVIQVVVGSIAAVSAVLAAFAIKALLAVAPVLILIAAVTALLYIFKDTESAANMLASILSDIRAKFNGLSPVAQAAAAGVAGFLTVLAVAKIYTFITALAAFAVATWAAFAPWIIAAVVIGVVTALVYAFGDSIGNVFNGLGSVFSNTWSGMKDGAVAAINFIVAAYETAVGKLKDMFAGLKNVFSGIGDAIGSAASWAGGKIGITTDSSLKTQASMLPAAGAKASVEGQVNINIKDPGNNATVSSQSNGNVPVNVGQTRGGSYRSTIPSAFTPGPR